MDYYRVETTETLEGETQTIVWYVHLASLDTFLELFQKYDVSYRTVSDPEFEILERKTLPPSLMKMGT